MAEAAGNVFGPINAETNDITQFSSSLQEGTCVLSAAAAAKNNGTYGFQVVMDGTNDQCYGIKTFAEQVEVYARAYFYIPSTFNHAAAWSNMYLLTLYDGGVMVGQVGTRVLGTGTTPVSWVSKYVSAEHYSATAFALDSWIPIEIRYLADGAAGGIEVWIGGNKDAALGDLDQATTYAPDSVRAGVQDEVVPANDYLYFDDLKGSTSYIGTYTEEGGASIIPALSQYYRRLRA